LEPKELDEAHHQARFGQPGEDLPDKVLSINE
jgi:hypothetical protein